MKYNFDEIIDRNGTCSSKYDFIVENGKPTDVLPMWVADMDFKTPQPVIDALSRAVTHGIYGYSDPMDGYYAALQNWYINRFNYRINKEWIVNTPGVVFALAAAVQAFTSEGDAIMIQRPVYHPFARIIRANQRKLVDNALIYKNGAYTIDFDDFENCIVKNQVKLFILCSPHNPVGRVWTENELVRMGQILKEHNVLVISDEIHADFVYPGHTHTVFAKANPDFADHIITCTAPSKTFNLAGLQISNILIQNESLRKDFQNVLNRIGYGGAGLMGITACQAAYEHGAEWLDSLIDYLKGNVDFVRHFLSNNLPQIHLVEPEGTYLLWLDFSSLGLSPDALEDLIVNHAKLWLDRGAMFGEAGEGFERFNIACPRSVIERAFSQLKEAIDTIA